MAKIADIFVKETLALVSKVELAARYRPLMQTNGVDGALAAAGALTQDASKYVNDASVEYFWAAKTFKYAETHFKLISSFDASKLRLTKYDDQIYRQFKRFFKDFKVDVIKEEDLKTEESKMRWRPFCELFKGKVEDYNFGTLLRKDCSKDYSEENSTLVTRIQFYAIEIARNKRGLNKCHYKDKSAAEQDSEGTNQEKTCENSEVTDQERTGEQTEPSETEHNTES